MEARTSKPGVLPNDRPLGAFGNPESTATRFYAIGRLSSAPREVFGETACRSKKSRSSRNLNGNWFFSSC